MAIHSYLNTIYILINSLLLCERNSQVYCMFVQLVTLHLYLKNTRYKKNAGMNYFYCLIYFSFSQNNYYLEDYYSMLMEKLFLFK